MADFNSYREADLQLFKTNKKSLCGGYTLQSKYNAETYEKPGTFFIHTVIDNHRKFTFLKSTNHLNIKPCFFVGVVYFRIQ